MSYDFGTSKQSRYNLIMGQNLFLYNDVHFVQSPGAAQVRVYRVIANWKEILSSRHMGPLECFRRNQKCYTRNRREASSAVQKAGEDWKPDERRKYLLILM